MRAAIVLAAGASRRFGRADKLRALIGGRTVLEHALDRALASDAERILIVSCKPRRVRALDRRLRAIRVRNARHGLAASLRAGLNALRPIDREVWIFLGDMPLASAPHQVRLRAGETAARAVVAGVPGHPMLVRTHAARTALRSGDRGLGNAFPVDTVQTWEGMPGNLLDIDDRAALRLARQTWR